MTPRTSYFLGVAAALATVLLLVFGIGALGIIGDGGQPDRVYVTVLAVLVLASLAARLRAHGMVVALLLTAFTQVVVTVAALLAELHGEASVVDILGITAMYAALFTLSAWFFWRADRDGTYQRAGEPSLPGSTSARGGDDAVQRRTTGRGGHT